MSPCTVKSKFEHVQRGTGTIYRGCHGWVPIQKGEGPLHRGLGQGPCTGKKLGPPVDRMIDG